jgi:hypothetical protein
LFWLSLLASLTLAAAREHPKSTRERTTNPDAPIRIAVELRDGSRILGMPGIKTLPVQTSFAKMDVPLKLVEAVEFEDDRETARIRFTNGDELHGFINLSSIRLTTAFADLTVSLTDVARLTTLAGGIRRDCILHYGFDQDERQTASDETGKGNKGRLHGTTWTSRGKSGGARVFNGRSDYLCMDYDESSGLFPKDTPFSVAAWFKTSATSPIQQTIVATHYAGYGRDGYFLYVDTRSRGGKACWLTGSQDTLLESKSAVNDGQWHHAVGTWDPRESRLYLDGVLQGKSPTARSLVYEHRAPFRVGHVANNGAPHALDEFYYFTGTIDEVMVFHRALSQNDVKALFDAPR